MRIRFLKKISLRSEEAYNEVILKCFECITHMNTNQSESYRRSQILKKKELKKTKMIRT